MSVPKVGDTSRIYVVYYDAPSGRRSRSYGRGAEGSRKAIEWAQEHPEKRPEVCERITTTVWVEGWDA
jgi:hypothetical protein